MSVYCYYQLISILNDLPSFASVSVKSWNTVKVTPWLMNVCDIYSCGQCTASHWLLWASRTLTPTSMHIRLSWISGVAWRQAFFSFCHILKWFVCSLVMTQWRLVVCLSRYIHMTLTDYDVDNDLSECSHVPFTELTVTFCWPWPWLWPGPNWAWLSRLQCTWFTLTHRLLEKYMHKHVRELLIWFPWKSWVEHKNTSSCLFFWARHFCVFILLFSWRRALCGQR